ncbi:MAG: hypothetical protein LBI56_00375 [Puniceicoccales bacterium]|jgi:hypothetical protein|nr:hypothetical protein [Puniceicoccales bacterium]
METPAAPVNILIVSLIFICCGGCNSIAKMHHSRLERIYRIHGEIAEISKQLQDIEQIMLYVGRIKDTPLADAALDVAIAIQGEPDESEKRYAESITLESLEPIKLQVIDLVNLRSKLELISLKENQKAIDDSYAIRAIESRYQFLEKLIFKCAAGVCIVVAIFFLKKIF